LLCTPFEKRMPFSPSPKTRRLEGLRIGWPVRRTRSRPVFFWLNASPRSTLSRASRRNRRSRRHLQTSCVATKTTQPATSTAMRPASLRGCRLLLRTYPAESCSFFGTSVSRCSNRGMWLESVGLIPSSPCTVRPTAWAARLRSRQRRSHNVFTLLMP